MKRGLVVTVVAVVLLEEALPSPSRGVAGPRVRSNSNSGSNSGSGSGPDDDGRGNLSHSRGLFARHHGRRIPLSWVFGRS